MNITCEWMVLAERVIEDSTTHNLTIVSCLEQLQALSFPAQHNGFAVAARFRCAESPPKRERKVKMRLVRVSEHDPDEVISEVDSPWKAGVRTARWVMNFQFLRLKRAETLGFRLEYKLGRSAWQLGASSSLDVIQMELSDEHRQKLIEEFQARGLPTDSLD